MIPRRSRLPRSLFGTGWKETVRTPYFLLKAKENREKKGRIGVIVGISVHKAAARRNFFKRRAKAALVGAKIGGKDVLLIVSREANGLPAKKFREEVVRAVARLGKEK